MAEYQYIQNDQIKRLSDGVVIPRDHRLWRRFVKEAKDKGLSFDSDETPIPDESWLLTMETTPLSFIKSEAVEEVDRQADHVRLYYADGSPRVTPGNYQPDEYARAKAQAEAYQAGTITNSPTLQADVDAGTVDPRDGSTVIDQSHAADLVLYMDSQWSGVLDQIRSQRLKAKRDIERASNKTQVQSVLDSLNWPE